MTPSTSRFATATLRIGPIYIALAVTVEGTRDVLGLWAGEHGDGEGAKFWARVLSEIKNRGTQDVCMAVCDGLTGLPAAIETVWPQAITQTCIVHLLRNSFSYASKRHWPAIAKDLKPIYTAPSESAALEAFVAFTDTWGEGQVPGRGVRRRRVILRGDGSGGQCRRHVLLFGR